MKRTINVDDLGGVEDVTTVRPGDLVVFRVAEDFTLQHVEQLRRQITAALPGYRFYRFIIVPTTVEVVGASTMPRPASSRARQPHPAALTPGTAEHHDYVAEALALAEVDVAPQDDPDAQPPLRA